MNTRTSQIILAGIGLLAATSFLMEGWRLTAQDEPMPYAPGAFGVWGWDWPAAGGDAQRSSFVKNDRWISRATVAKPGLRLQYKISLPNTSRQMNALSQPILIQTARGLTGFKSMGFVSGSGGTLFGFDYDTHQVLWKNPLGSAGLQASGTLACPGGMTTGMARPTPLTPPNVTDTESGRGVAPGNLPGARKSGTAVGAPGEGAPIVAALARAASDPAAGRGGAFGGSGRGGGGGGRGGAAGVYALSPDGKLHQLSMQQGFDIVMQPVAFLPTNANAAGLIVVDNFAYASTSNNCGGVANGVWALDLGPAKAVTNWTTGGANIVGNIGPAFGADGTVFVATSDSVVALEPKTLKMRDSFSAAKSPFNSSPVAFAFKGRNLVAASNRDGKLYLLDGVSLGGADHQTPLAVSAKLANNTTDFEPGALTSWMDSGGTRRILVPGSGAVAAFKVEDQNGKPVLVPAWTSRELNSPVAPVVVNGVVFALSTGEFHSSDATLSAAQRATRSQPAVLYALDGFTGKEIWNSTRTITSFSPHTAGLAASTGQVYVTTFDNMVYAFGFEEKE